MNRAFALGIILNTAFVLVEAGYGIYADSLALIADAGHNLSDVLSLILAWGASRLAQSRPTVRRTYGLRRATNLASLISSLVLLLVMGGIAWEALGRFREPAMVAGNVMIIVAAIGVLINGFTAWLFAAGREHDLNVKAAFQHMAADAAVSVGVVIGGIAIVMRGWYWVDPIITLVIVAIIVVTTWSVFRDSLDLAFDAVPGAIDPDAVRDYLCGLPGVATIHDLHIWGMSTTETALTTHLVMPAGGDDAFLREVSAELCDRFRIAHATIQIEQGDFEHGCDQE